MDLRTERTRQSIKNAFFELRKQKPLEKISVKELAELAYINKATFYTHYHDIFDLADQLEDEFFDSVLKNAQYMDCLVTNPSIAVQELTRELSSNRATSDILFSGSRQGYYSQKLNLALRKVLDAKYPERIHDLQWNIILTILIQGCYHAFQAYYTEDNIEEVSRIIGKINQCLVDQFL